MKLIKQHFVTMWNDPSSLAGTGYFIKHSTPLLF